MFALRRNLHLEQSASLDRVPTKLARVRARAGARQRAWARVDVRERAHRPLSPPRSFPPIQHTATRNRSRSLHPVLCFPSSPPLRPIPASQTETQTEAGTLLKSTN